LQRNNCRMGKSWCWVNNGEPDEVYDLKFCDGLDERYGIYSNTLKTLLVGEREIKADPNFSSLYTTCPALGDPHQVSIPWIADFQIQRTTCVPGIPEPLPTVGQSFGTAFAYASYFEFIVTVLVIQSLLMCGFLKTAQKVVSYQA